MHARGGGRNPKGPYLPPGAHVSTKVDYNHWRNIAQTTLLPPLLSPACVLLVPAVFAVYSKWIERLPLRSLKAEISFKKLYTVFEKLIPGTRLLP